VNAREIEGFRHSQYKTFVLHSLCRDALANFTIILTTSEVYPLLVHLCFWLPKTNGSRLFASRLPGIAR
jgi:hypothetical protein